MRHSSVGHILEGGIIRLALAAMVVASIYALAVHSAGLPTGTTTRQLSGFTIVSVDAASGTPKVSLESASQAALRAFTSPEFTHPQPVGIKLQSNTFNPGLTEVRDSKGDPLFTSRKALNAWLLWYSAPAQPGFSKINGFAVVNSDTGSVVSISLVSEP